MDPAAWHTLSEDAVTLRLGVDRTRGLPTTEAAARLTQQGPNRIAGSPARSWRGMLFAQFSDFMILLLIAAAVISGLVGDVTDTLVILAIVALNAVIGFVQEYRANRAVAALKQLAVATATVIRDGQHRSVPAESVVPGDVVILEAGNAVPADLRLFEAVDLRLGESALTGESLPVEKRTTPLGDAAQPLADRHNMAFKGTMVLFGRGRGVVVATGMATELGRIAGMLDAEYVTRTPLQRQLSVLGRQIAIGAVAICLAIFAAGLLRGEPPLLMVLTALSLAVAAIPEALPAVVTVVLSLGAARMARQNALVRRLPAVETLGSVTVICSDKTGTLTRNEMQATEAHIGAERLATTALDATREPAATLLRALALCNDVAPGVDGEPLGDPTEIALWRAAAGAGLDKSQCELSDRRILDLPFDSERKQMTTVHRDVGGLVSYTKGAPETVLAACTAQSTKYGEVPLDRAEAVRAAERMAQDGLRVLAVASRRWPELPGDPSPLSMERGLTLLGLIGLLDPPRAEAAQAVATCRMAGILPVMITGDHPATARAVARQLGMLEGEAGLLTGRQLQELSDAELRRAVRDTQVYARVDPAQKIRVVAALQDVGEIVAMTGDGVNDAPALTRADIGVAMGKVGTDVARESASLVLLDDNFATIVAAVREGRRIYDNVRKFIRFVVTCNAAEICAIFVAPFLGLPLLLLPTQILWMNLVTDGLPGLALVTEPAEPDVMRRPPRPPRQGLFAGGMLLQIVWASLLIAGSTLVTAALAIQAGRDSWQTMAFTVLTLAQMWQVMAIRSEHATLLHTGLFANKPLLGAVTLTLALQLALIYLPPLNPIFGTTPLTLAELAFCIAMSSLVCIALEAQKWLYRSRARTTRVAHTIR